MAATTDRGHQREQTRPTLRGGPCRSQPPRRESPRREPVAVAGASWARSTAYLTEEEVPAGRAAGVMLKARHSPSPGLATWRTATRPVDEGEGDELGTEEAAEVLTFTARTRGCCATTRTRSEPSRSCSGQGGVEKSWAGFSDKPTTVIGEVRLAPRDL